MPDIIRFRSCRFLGLYAILTGAAHPDQRVGHAVPDHLLRDVGLGDRPRPELRVGRPKGVAAPPSRL